MRLDGGERETYGQPSGIYDRQSREGASCHFRKSGVLFPSSISSLQVENLSTATQGWRAVVARSEMPHVASDYFQGAPYPVMMLFVTSI